jgi:hypothetical protein
MNQTRKHSFIESWVNVGVGYIVALASQIVIFPLFNINVTFKDNIYIGLWFTAVSVVRSYALRRYFTKVRRW